MTKSGLFKDARDTQRRRTRHRDGRLLRGGIGLTTGLGWSDRYVYFPFSPLRHFVNLSRTHFCSEDEDAPSPLTRRLSSLILSRKESSNSLRSSSGLSRSVSDTLTHASATLEHHQQRSTTKPRSASSLPPTSWQRSPGIRSSASSTSTMQSTAFGGSSARTSNATDYSSLPPSRRTSETLPSCEESMLESSSSTSSASSLPMPLTPADDTPSLLERPRSKTPAKSALRKIPSTVSLRGGASSGIPSARSRALSTSSNSSVAASVGSHAHSSVRTPSSSIPSRTPIPRPLRLPQAGALQASSLSTPSVSPRSSAASSPVSHPQAMRARAISGTSSIPSASKMTRPGVHTNSLPASSSVPSMERPKPRTGTGMTYRTGSSSISGRQTVTAMRPPSTPLLRASASGAKT